MVEPEAEAGATPAPERRRPGTEAETATSPSSPEPPTTAEQAATAQPEAGATRPTSPAQSTSEQSASRAQRRRSPRCPPRLPPHPEPQRAAAGRGSRTLRRQLRNPSRPSRSPASKRRRRDASAPTPTAEAAIEAFDLAGLAVAGVEASASSPRPPRRRPPRRQSKLSTWRASRSPASKVRRENLALSGEAAPGTPDARDVTIKAAEVEAKTLYVAGEAPAGTLVRVYANDELVGEVARRAPTAPGCSRRTRTCRSARWSSAWRPCSEGERRSNAGRRGFGAVHALRGRRRAGAGRDRR